METRETTREQLMTKIDILQMEIAKLKETAAKTVEEAAFRNQEKDKRAAELVIADKELAFQIGEKADRAAELNIANKELAFQNAEKDKRAAELQNVQLLLKSSEECFRSLFEQAPVGIAINRNGRLQLVNQTYADMFGYETSSELTDTLLVNQIAPGNRSELKDKVNDLEAGAVKTQQHEMVGLRKDGSIFDAFVQANHIDLPDGPADIAFLTDISDRKRAEASLQRKLASQSLLLEISNNFNGVVADDIDDVITVALRLIGEFDHADRCYVAVFSADQSIISNTHGWCAEGISAAIDIIRELPVDRVFYWMKDNLQSLGYTYIPWVDDLPPAAQAEKEMLQVQSIQSLFAVPMFLENKILGFLCCDSIRGEKTWSEDSIIMLKSVAQIISKAMLRQQFAHELLISENYYRTIFENTGAATMVIEEDLTISSVNEECQRLLGYAPEDLIGKKWTDFIPSDIVNTVKEYRLSRQAHLVAVPLKYQTRIIDRHGSHQDGLLAVDIIPGTNKSVVNFIDFTEFNRIGRALKATSAVNTTMLKAENEEELLRIVCQKVVEVGGYSLAWVAYLQADQQTVQPVAYAGKDEGYLTKVNIDLKDPKRGQGPIASAIRTGQPVVAKDLEKDSKLPWLQDALRRGFKCSMAIPLMANNKAFGALSIYSTEMGRFDSDEQNLLTEMACDLAFGIMSLRDHIEKNQTAEELKISLEKMRRILMQAVTSLGATLDTRDPYTAGHQRRVAHLAAAMAIEMGLSKDQIEGITVAGNLHDIGKTNIPSEILSKPGKLSDLEFAMIKTHPQAGYEIVKGIEFPWPVAEVLLQHHERMNGSGYPRGLAGGEILVEARIMAVADVVEAMSAHRPYRPALGMDAALEEISQNRGILYDPDVVDACLKLLMEQGFKLEI